VSAALGTVSINAGLGLGLFGVLAIIRLRSAELDHHEIAYYFSALALGIIGGLGADMGWPALALMALILAVAAVGDSAALFKRYRSQNVVLDVAVANQVELTARLEVLLGARVVSATVRKLDLVNDMTDVDVRFELLPSHPSDSILLQAQEVAR
ncbi:MAG: DUF4956 domain-containing protein, partial [Propionibacteriaceae bacterium]|jgi:hypothetical protein|nr:DUF4956 domain-containing protein [Propionibacteriaceae bacterium]